MNYYDCVWHHWIHSVRSFSNSHFTFFLIRHAGPEKKKATEVVLMNPNIASGQTNTDDKSPARPTTSFPSRHPDLVEEVKKEKPDGIVSMGGCTAISTRALKCNAGTFGKYGVEVLPLMSLSTEDRQLFSDRS
jgi:carbamoyl-phosphate synthase (ammonia)